MSLTLLRSLIFALLFYVSTAIFVVGGSFLLFGPRRYAMMGLKAHAIVSLWLLRTIVGTRMEVRGREKLPKPPYSSPPSTNRPGTPSRSSRSSPTRHW